MHRACSVVVSILCLVIQELSNRPTFRYKCSIVVAKNATNMDGYIEKRETMIRLLLIGEDLFVRQGLHMRLGFEADITVVGEASTGAQALALMQTVRPNVVVIDQILPGLDILTTITSLWALYPECAIVVLYLYDEPSIQAQAQATGAIIFVGKREGVKDLLAAIRQASG